MTTTATTQITYRKTRQGAWVAFGPADVVKAGEVVNIAKRNGAISRRLVESTGKVFIVDGERMVYGYLADGEVPATTTAAQVEYAQAAHQAAQAATVAPTRKASAARTYTRQSQSWTRHDGRCTTCGGTLTDYDREVAAIPGVHADCI